MYITGNISKISNNIQPAKASVKKAFVQSPALSQVKQKAPSALKLAIIASTFGKVAKEIYLKMVNGEEDNSKFSTEDLNKIFEENGFKKDKSGAYKKKLGKEERKELDDKYGVQDSTVRKYYESSFKPLEMACFKDFLQMGWNLDAVKENFNKFFIIFRTLMSSTKYDVFRDKFQKNPAQAELIDNIIKNPVDRGTFDAFTGYKRTNYMNINYELRKKAMYPEYQIPGWNLTDINNMSKYIETQKISKPMNLYRAESLEGLRHVLTANGERVNLVDMMEEAVSSKKPENIAKVREFVLDNEITAIQDGYVSTSIDKNFVDKSEFKEKMGIVWSLKTAPNTKGMFMEAINFPQMNSNENEVLLQNGSKIKITDINYDKSKKIWEISGEVSN